MSIHINLVQVTKPFTKPITIFEKKFETTDEAFIWWDYQDFNCESVLDVLLATRKEYVGTEHEVMNAAGDGYTDLFICIEGQEGKDTFDHHMMTLEVNEIIDHGDGQYQLNGTTMKGRTWITIKMMDPVKMRKYTP